MLLSGLALAVLLGTPILYFLGMMELDTMKNWMLIATIAWFATAILWMGRPEDKI